MSFICFINYLLWIKADLYSCFQGGHSALHYAAFSGSDGIVKLLLSKKADATLTAGVGFLEFARNLTVKVASPFPSPSHIPTPLLCLSGESTRQCSLGSNPQGNAICGLSLLLVLAYVPREYFCEYPSFYLSSIISANMHFIFGPKIRVTLFSHVVTSYHVFVLCFSQLFLSRRNNCPCTWPVAAPLVQWKLSKRY